MKQIGKVNKIERLLYDEIVETVIKNVDYMFIEKNWKIYQEYIKHNEYNQTLFDSAKNLIKENYGVD